MEDINPKLLQGLTPEQRRRVLQLMQRKRLAKMAKEKLDRPEKKDRPSLSIRGTDIFGFKFGSEDE